MDAEPLWLSLDDVVAVHQDQLDRYGGLPGTKDAGLIDSAVHAPINRYLYEHENDLLTLALVLCRALAKNHGFVDGNKRTAAAAMLLFLELNGYELIVSDDDPDAPWLGRIIEQIAGSALPLERAYALFVSFLRPLP